MLSLRIYGPCTALLGSFCRSKTVSVRTSVMHMYSDYDDDDESESPGQLQKHIEYAFTTKDAKELGQRTAVRLQILRLLPAVLSLYGVRVFLLVALPVIWYYGSYGLTLSLLLQIAAYIVSRPFVESARNYIGGSADTLIQAYVGEINREPLPGNRYISLKFGRFTLKTVRCYKDIWFMPYLKLEKFVLARHMHLIPAAAIRGKRFGGVLEQLLPQDPKVRETVVKLADNYYDSAQSLVAACELLA